MQKENAAQHLLIQVPGRGKRHARAAAARNIHTLSTPCQLLFACAPSTSHRERDDNYRGVIYRILGWRVIICRDGIQWIIQSSRCAGRRHIEWKGRSYCHSRSVLLRDWRRHTGDDCAVLAVHLPDRIGGVA